MCVCADVWEGGRDREKDEWREKERKGGNGGGGRRRGTERVSE